MNSISLSQKQSNAWHYLEDNITTEILYGGGAGGGKSYLGCLWHIQRRVKYKETRGLIGRRELKSIKESTLVTYFKVCHILGYQIGRDYRFNANDMVIIWSNGSRTIFKDLEFIPSDENFERLGSTEYTDAFIDEAGEITLKAFDIVNSRLRWMLTDYGLIPKILLTCNPNNNWIKSKYIKDEKGNYIHLRPYQKYVQALVTDNPDTVFANTYINQLGKLSSGYDIDRLLRGDWDAAPKSGGEFYKLFAYDVNSRNSLEYDPEIPLHASFDFNVNPYMTCTIWQISGKAAVQIDEICLKSPRNTTEAVCREFINRYPGHAAGLFIYGDPSGNKADTRSGKGVNDYIIIRRTLAQYHPVMRVAPSAPPVVIRGNFMNVIFSQQFDGITVTIGRNCVNTMNDYQYGKEASDGTKLKERVRDANTGVVYEKYHHCSDANDYMLCKAFAREFLLFQRLGSSARISMGKGRARNTY